MLSCPCGRQNLQFPQQSGFEVSECYDRSKMGTLKLQHGCRAAINVDKSSSRFWSKIWGRKAFTQILETGIWYSELFRFFFRLQYVLIYDHEHETVFLASGNTICIINVHFSHIATHSTILCLVCHTSRLLAYSSHGYIVVYFVYRVKRCVWAKIIAGSQAKIKHHSSRPCKEWNV